GSDVSRCDRAFPPMVIGAFVFAGVGHRDIAAWVVAHRPAIRLINALSLTLFGTFMIVFWVVAFPLAQRVWGSSSEAAIVWPCRFVQSPAVGGEILAQVGMGKG